MPWQSEAQRRWGNSPEGHKALGKAGVKEWNDATGNKKLPERVKRAAKKVSPTDRSQALRKGKASG
jgi:hypothetical protein